MGITVLLFLYGLRHGFDWDHIAAITSISGTPESKGRRFFRSFLYILGHASVIIMFGSLAILFGLLLPSWIDGIMEPLVGLTLMFLGAWMLYSYYKKKEHTHLVSRGQLLFTAFYKIKEFFSKKSIEKQEVANPYASPFIIGCIHGIGAETPTQMLLFLSVGKVDGKLEGVSLLLIFVTGLILSNTLISSIATLSYSVVKKYKVITTLLILISAALSMFIGTAILLGKGDLIPALISG